MSTREKNEKTTKQFHFRDWAYRAARHLRNADMLSPDQWDTESQFILSDLREYDEKTYKQLVLSMKKKS